MTDQDAERVWNTLNIAKVLNSKVYELEKHVQGARERYNLNEREINTAMDVIQSGVR